jgi:hypothetical protein
MSFSLRNNPRDLALNQWRTLLAGAARLRAAAEEHKAAGREGQSKLLAEHAANVEPAAGRIVQPVFDNRKREAPTADLHRAIVDARDQVQQLRQDVARVREILEKKP